MSRTTFFSRYLLAIAVLLIVLPAIAVTSPDLGIPINYGKTPLAMPWTTFKGNAIVAAFASPYSTTGNDWAGAFRGDVSATMGGQYNGTDQSAYPGFSSNVDMFTQGQAIGYAAYVRGFGKGNSTPLNAVSQCYGGGEVSLPSSTPLCAATGEFDAVQGDQTFDATIVAPASSGMTTLHYSSPHNEATSGARLILNINHVHSSGTISAFTPCSDSSAGACSFTGGTCPGGTGSACTVVTFAGTSGFPVGQSNIWAFKTGSQNDQYSGACQGSDVSLANNGANCISGGGSAPCCAASVWYQIATIPDSTHIVLKGVFDSNPLGTYIGTSSYIMIQALEASDVNHSANTIAFPTNSLNWAAGETIYSPPNFYTNTSGAVFVLYQNSNAAMASAGLSVTNRGPQRVENGLIVRGPDNVVGGFYTGIKIENLNPKTSRPAGSDELINNTRGIDIDGSTNYALLIGGVGNFSPPRSVFAMGSSGEDQQYCDDVYHHMIGLPIAVDTGIKGDGGGFKHKRISTGSILASATTNVTLTWGTAFPDDNYTVSCGVLDAAGFLFNSAQVISAVAGTVVVPVSNFDSGAPHTGTLECIGIHD